MFAIREKFFNLRYDVFQSTRPIRLLKNWTVKKYQSYLLEGINSGITIKELQRMYCMRSPWDLPLIPNSLLLGLYFRFKVLSILRFFIIIDSELGRTLRKTINRGAQSLCPAFSKDFHQMTFCPDDEFILKFHVIPSAYGFKWDSPNSLLRSTKNYFKLGHPHKIGHAYVELVHNERTVIATGMTGETNYQVISNLLTKKQGFEFLARTFRGRVEKFEEVKEDIQKHKNLGKIKTMVKFISIKEFKDCILFLENWMQEGHYQKYGLIECPQETFGASCTSFSIEFLKICNQISSSELLAWQRKIFIPREHYRNCHFLKFATLFFKRENWKSFKSKECKELKFYDPDFIYQDLLKRPF